MQLPEQQEHNKIIVEGNEEKKPEKSTKELIDEATMATDPKSKLERTTTYGYQQLFPRFEKQLKEMSAQQLRQAWRFAMMHPILDHQERACDKKVIEAFAMAIKLDEYKFGMLLLGIDKFGKDLADAPVQSTPDETLNGNESGLGSGSGSSESGSST